jgi:hypothetical protein
MEKTVRASSVDTVPVRMGTDREFEQIAEVFKRANLLKMA